MVPVVIFVSAFIANPPLIVISSEIGSAKNLYLNKLESYILQITHLKILKFDVEMHLNEVDAIYILFQKTASVSVPYIHNIYKIGEVDYIIIEYIPESIFRECWGILSTAEKKFLKI
jgi:hypothetical protein